jgi:hypothetical protein
MPSKCNRGVVLEVNLDPSTGSEYMKTRPCLVVQSDLLNKYSRVTIVSPITGAENIKPGGRPMCRFPKVKAGFQKTVWSSATTFELLMNPD